VEVYTQFVNAAVAQKSQQEYYLAAEGRMLGNDEFLDEMKHRAGEHVRSGDRPYRTPDIEAIMKAAEKATSLHRQEFCTKGKARKLVMAKEAIIMIGLRSGIRNRELADALGLDPSAVSKRWEAARGRAEDSHEMVELLRKMRSMV
jgi:hypothetical protein